MSGRDLLGMFVLSCIGAHIGFNYGEREWIEPAAWALLVLGLALFVEGGRRERRRANPIGKRD